MKQEQSAENRLDGSVMQQVSEHQNNMGMGMMDNMGLGIPMMMSSANQQQITSVPMDTSGNSVQTVQAVPVQVHKPRITKYRKVRRALRSKKRKKKVAKTKKTRMKNAMEMKVCTKQYMFFFIYQYFTF